MSGRPPSPASFSTSAGTAWPTAIPSSTNTGSSQPPLPTTLSLPKPVNLGPLTTAFSQPSNCADVYVSYEKNLASWVLARDQACTDSGPVPNTACFPSSIATGTQFPDANFYSPGVACPIGYAQAASSKSLDKTLNWCCPTKFKKSAGACFSTPSSESSTIVVHQCNEFDYGRPFNYTFYLNHDGSTYFVSFVPSQRSLSTSGLVTGPLYATVTAQQVLIALDNTTAFTTYSTYPSTASSTSTSSVSPNRNDKKSSLSPGAVAGVVVAVVIFVGCVIMLIWRYGNRRRRQKDTKEVPNDDGGTTDTADDVPVDSGVFRVHDLYANPDDRLPSPADEPSGDVGRTNGNNRGNQAKLQKIRPDGAIREQEPQTSEATATERPRAAHSSTIPGNITPPDSNENTMQSYRHFETQAIDGDDTDTISEGDTQMGTPRTGEISETASIVIGNLPKPEAAPRDYQIADLEYRLSELRRLKMLEEEQARREGEK